MLQMYHAVMRFSLNKSEQAQVSALMTAASSGCTVSGNSSITIIDSKAKTSEELSIRII